MEERPWSRQLASLRAVHLVLALGACLIASGSSGCAALTNPVAEGIPATRLPAEYLGKPREEEKTIPLTWLRQLPPPCYLLDAGDLLGVHIEGILGDQPVNLRMVEPGTNLQPGYGVPIPVSKNGTLPLPLIPPVPVRGLTLEEAQQLIVWEYEKPRMTQGVATPVPILNPGSARVVVTLYRQRMVHVQVVRQDSGGILSGPGGVIGTTKRGSGTTVDLAAYENDVLTALNRTGGLPGLDAVNEIVIQRGGMSSNGCVIRIPLRLRPGEPPPFKPNDVVLGNGDILFIEGRDTEVFYTGGLLPPKQFVLPRDYDLRVVDAIALCNGPLVNGGFNQNNYSGAVIASGLGSPSPSRVSVIRRTHGFGQLVISVDLNRALRDQRENILIQPGDVLVLQETPGEAITRYLTLVFHANFLANIINQGSLQSSTTLNVP